MMKIKTIIALSALSITAAYAQDSIVLDDFESGAKGWEDVSGAFSEIVSNPSPDNVNSSSKVLKCTRPVGTDNWAGVILRGVYSLNIGSGDNDYSYATVKFLKQTQGDVAFKLESGPADNYEYNTAYLGGNGWTTVTFDLKSAPKGTYKDFFVMVDRGDLQRDAVVYIDEVTLLKKLDQQSSSTYDPNSQRGTGEVDGYHLVWEELFDDGKLSNVWNIEENGYGGYNNELQYYSRNNIEVGKDSEGNGCLIITARKEQSNGKSCTSGRLNTQGKMKFCHGKVEASIRLPKTANGLWPAFWMMGDEVGSWPANGEIDILEMGNAEAFNRGSQDRYFNGACHWGPSSNAHEMSTQSVTWDYSLQDGEFHLYTLYWDDQRLVMYVDQDRYPNARPYFQLDIRDRSSQRSAGTYFHHEFHLLFNLAIGGDFPKIYDINQISALQNGEAKMYVNYVKVYQKGVQGESYTGPVMEFTGMEELCAAQKGLDELSGVIYNMSGLLVKRFDAGESSVIETLKEGIYIIRLENGESFKIIKKK